MKTAKEQGYPVPVSINGISSSTNFARAFTTPATASRRNRVEAWNLLCGVVTCDMQEIHGGPFEVVASNGERMVFKNYDELSSFYMDMFDDACDDSKYENLHSFLFPSLKTARWGYLNLAEEHRRSGFRKDGQNLLLDPGVCDDWIRQLHQERRIDYSHGGYLEDRSLLWQGSYIKPDEGWHLGIDYNVPEGTAVCLPISAKLMLSSVDPDKRWGWGGKLVFEAKGMFLILGHLREMVAETEHIYERGSEVGVIASPLSNGGWYPHLHVQIAGRLDLSLDGYGQIYQGIEEDFPRPDAILVPRN